MLTTVGKVKEGTAHFSNRSVPIVPFPGLVLVEPGGIKYTVFEVSCFIQQPGEDNKDRFGNSLSVLVKPKQ
ncbi:hypothetical protein KKC93_00195 [Patescibacteria group bacterium]|nr:hypothetical protein [Patescibacteria group bacterium]